MVDSQLATKLATAQPRASRRRRAGRWAAFSMGVLMVVAASFAVLTATTGGHTLLPVSYAGDPPTHGDHSPVWQRCGFYSEPVGNEHAVHSLEHGAIWITYQPDLPEAQKEVLRAIARAHEDVVVSPYPGLLTPVVVAVWGRHVPLEDVGKEEVERAITDLRNGPEAPEPDGGCEGTNLWFTGATGDPEP